MQPRALFKHSMIALCLASAFATPSSGQPGMAGPEAAIDGISGTVTLSPGLASDDIRYLETGLRTTQSYFASELGTTLPRPVAITMSTPESCLGKSTSTGGATADKLCVWAGSPTWIKLKANPLDAIALVAHEHVHNFQGQLGCLPERRREYRWFTEGMAVHLSWRAITFAGLAKETDYQAWRTRYTQDGKPLQSLGRYAARVPDDRAYDLATVAVAELAKQGGGDKSLVAFCRSAEPDWKAAFANTFGEKVETFIARFDKAHGLPERK